MAIEKSCVEQKCPSLTQTVKQIASYEESFQSKVSEMGQCTSHRQRARSFLVLKSTGFAPQPRAVECDSEARLSLEFSQRSPRSKLQQRLKHCQEKKSLNLGMHFSKIYLLATQRVSYCTQYVNSVHFGPSLPPLLVCQGRQVALGSRSPVAAKQPRPQHGQILIDVQSGRRWWL